MPDHFIFFLRSGVLTTACVCVCVRVMCECVMYVCASLCVCSRMCVCLTQMSSFSNFDIIVLDWGAYKCVCVCLTRASSLIESNIIVLDWGCLQLRVCLTQMSSFSK